MRFQVLLSCMNRKEYGIIQESNLNDVPALLINQCECVEDEIKQLDEIHTVIDTNQRGLSNSRNMAIQNAAAEYCLLSDDDETFENGLEDIIVSEYEKNKNADIIAFVIENAKNRLGDRYRKLKKIELLRLASWQISFKLSSVKGRVQFDPKLGSGSGNGASEEIKFLLDCYDKGLNIYYCPVKIGQMRNSESQWFFGFDEKFFYQRGATSRYIYGLPFSVIYSLYYTAVKYPEYGSRIKPLKALKSTWKGIKECPLMKTEND